MSALAKGIMAIIPSAVCNFCASSHNIYPLSFMKFSAKCNCSSCFLAAIAKSAMSLSLMVERGKAL
jgi:hypothetical protein